MIGRNYGEDCSDEDSDGKNDDTSSDGSGTFDMDEEVTTELHSLFVHKASYHIGDI